MAGSPAAYASVRDSYDLKHPVPIAYDLSRAGAPWKYRYLPTTDA